MPEEINNQGDTNQEVSNVVPEINPQTPPWAAPEQNVAPEPAYSPSSNTPEVVATPVAAATAPVVEAQPVMPAVAPNVPVSTPVMPSTGGRLDNIKRFIMRWLPFIMLWNTFTAGLMLLTFGLPVILFSLATTWSSGVVYFIWSIFYLAIMVASFVLYLLTFLATYRRKPSAQRLVIIANYLAITSFVVTIVANGKLAIDGTFISVLFAVVTILAVKEYAHYFDPNVSGEKGLNLGDVPPSSGEKTLMYVFYSIGAAFMVITMLIMGFLMTIIGGGALTAAKMVPAPSFINFSSGKKAETSTNVTSKSTKSTETDTSDSATASTEDTTTICSAYNSDPIVVDNVSDIEGMLVRTGDSGGKIRALLPKGFKFDNSGTTSCTYLLSNRENNFAYLSVTASYGSVFKGLNIDQLIEKTVPLYASGGSTSSFEKTRINDNVYLTKITAVNNEKEIKLQNVSYIISVTLNKSNGLQEPEIYSVINLLGMDVSDNDNEQRLLSIETLAKKIANSVTIN